MRSGTPAGTIASCPRQQNAPPQARKDKTREQDSLEGICSLDEPEPEYRAPSLNRDERSGTCPFRPPLQSHPGSRKALALMRTPMAPKIIPANQNSRWRVSSVM